MKLRPGDFIEEVKGHLKLRVSDPRGIIIDFEGTQMDFEKFMDNFDKVEKYMKERAKEWDESIKGKPLPKIDVKV